MRSITFAATLLLALAAARAVPAGEIGLGAAEADSIAERTARSTLVAVAQAVKVRDSGIAECRLISLIKGQFKGGSFQVRFSRLQGGVWPERGVTALYFLKPLVGGGSGALGRRTIFELISDRDGLASPGEEVVALVRKAAAGNYIRSGQQFRGEIRLPEPGTLLGTMLDASCAAIGTVEEVNFSTDRGVRAKLTCRLEAVFKGRLAPGPNPVIVEVPQPEAAAADPNRRPLDVKVGPAVLVFSQDRKSGAYRLVSPYRGWWEIPRREEVAVRARELTELLAAEKGLRAQGLVGEPATRASVSQTLQLWQNSWNAKEVENVISCYSRRSKWFARWDSGPQGQEEVAATVRDYPAGICVSQEDPPQPRKDGAEMLVPVVITVVGERGQVTERRAVEMVFVRESGMWLILHEGN